MMDAAGSSAEDLSVEDEALKCDAPEKLRRRNSPLERKASVCHAALKWCSKLTNYHGRGNPEHGKADRRFGRKRRRANVYHTGTE